MEAAALVALVTCPAASAPALARGLVEGRFAACVNVLPAIQSIYRWEDEVRSDDEALLVIKTTGDRFEALRAKVLQDHPYELPEVLALPVAQGHAPYLAWLQAETRA